MDNIVVIHGDIVRGGGQVLRNSSAYAAILGKSVHLKNIGFNRPKPGLRPPHLEGLEAVAKLSKSTLVDAFVDSPEVYLVGGQLAASDSHSVTVPLTESAQQIFHTKDAAISLLLQATLPVLLFSPNVTELVLTGGAKMLVSASIDYMKHVLVPLLQNYFNVSVEVEIVRRDFMPSGDAYVIVRTKPVTFLPPICMRHRGSPVRVSSILYGYGRADQLFIDAVQTALNETLRNSQCGIDMDVSFSSDIQESETDFPLVCRVLIYAEMSTGCILGGGSTVVKDSSHVTNSNYSPKELASSAVEDLVNQLRHGGCTDEYLQDQLLIFMALADGVSEIVTGPITSHTRSAIDTAHCMTDAKFEVTPIADSPRFVIRCEGIGHLPRYRQQTSSVFLTCAQHRRQDFGDMFKHVKAT